MILILLIVMNRYLIIIHNVSGFKLTNGTLCIRLEFLYDEYIFSEREMIFMHNL